VHGRQDGDRLFVDIDARENTCGFRDARQSLLDDLGAEVLEVQVM
jgi:hypothetical protein